MGANGETLGGHETETLEQQLLSFFNETRTVLYADRQANTGKEDAPSENDLVKTLADLGDFELLNILRGSMPFPTPEVALSMEAFGQWAEAQKDELMRKQARRVYVERQNQRAMDIVGGKELHAVSRNIVLQPGIRVIKGDYKGLPREVTGKIVGVESDLAAIILETLADNERESELYWVNTFSTDTPGTHQSEYLTDIKIRA